MTVDHATARKVSHYNIIDRLGAGGMGEVFRADDTALGRKVALKLLPRSAAADRDANRRLIKEAQAAAQLDHPNICSIYEAGEDDGVCFIAMQLIEGQSLSDRILAGAIGEEEVLQLASQVADALAEAHRLGIVHRDIKPQNVLIDRRGQAKLMDFGLAKSWRPADEEETQRRHASTMSSPGALVGTMPYMSPEQVRGQTADVRSDVWALGVLLHELSTGQRPFSGESTAELISSILRDKPTPLPPGGGGRLGPVIDRCLRKNPGERFQDAGQVHAALEVLRASHPDQPPARRQRVAAARPRGAVPGRIRSIALLPLDSHSADPEQDYFAEAMTESLLTDLAQIGGLRVVSRTSVMRYKGTQLPISRIARALGVDAIIEGSVLRVGNRVRITAQLIHGATDQHLWAKSYEREAEDILTLQSEVARAIAEEVRVKLTPRERARLSSSRRVNRVAHEAYLKGIYHFDRLEMALGMEYFTQSTTLDPTYAPAWGRLARGYYFLGLFGAMAPIDAFTLLKEAAWKAQDLDPDLAEAYGWRAMASLYYDWNWSATGEELRRATELKPSHAEISHFYGHFLMVMGLTEEGLAACAEALKLDPLGMIITTCVGWHCLFSRHIDDAVAPAQRALAMDPNFFWAHTVLGWAYEQQGRAEDSIAEYDKAVALSGGMVMNVSALGHAYAYFGRSDDARAVLEQLLERRKSSYVSAYDIATIYVALGDDREAFRWLDEAFAEHASFLIHIQWDPRFDGLRDDARFGDLLARVGLPRLVQPEALGHRSLEEARP